MDHDFLFEVEQYLPRNTTISTISYRYSKAIKMSGKEPTLVRTQEKRFRTIS